MTLKKNTSGKNKSAGKSLPGIPAGSRLLIAAMAAIAFIGLVYWANHDRPTYKGGDTTGISYEVGQVVGIFSDNHVVDEESGGVWRGSMDIQVKILTGIHKGKVADVTNYFSALYNVRVLQGDKVSIRVDSRDDGTFQVSIYNYYRVPGIMICAALFVLLLIVIGGKKGAKSAVGLAFTLVCMLGVLLPLTLKGFSALWVTLGLILLCNLVSFVLIDGIQKKTIVAAAGSICGVIAGAVFAMIAQSLLSVTTYQMEEAETLMLIMSTTELEMKDLLLCGILIACMGAVMDVAMSIVSALSELHKANPAMSSKKLFLAGMRIGQDAMGTMSNTLILAFAGNSLNMMLMIYSYGIGFQQLMNTDFIAIEIIRSIAGSIGIICTVPISAGIAAYAYSTEKE